MFPCESYFAYFAFFPQFSSTNVVFPKGCRTMFPCKSYFAYICCCLFRPSTYVTDVRYFYSLIFPERCPAMICVNTIRNISVEYQYLRGMIRKDSLLSYMRIAKCSCFCLAMMSQGFMYSYICINFVRQNFFHLLYNTRAVRVI
jgi:hypothetical protein